MSGFIDFIGGPSAAKIRGTVIGNKWSGVVSGSVSNAQRVTNGTKLQEAINFASTNRKYFELEPGRYEINLPGGLIIPDGYQGFDWRGSRKGDTLTDKCASSIVQYADNTPILTVGSNTNNAYLNNIDGLKLFYGTDQTGKTLSQALRIKCLWRSSFRYLEVTPNDGFRPYDAVRIEGGSYYFQNTMEHCSFGHGQRDTLSIRNFGTGNVWRDLYLGGGAPVATPISGSLLNLHDAESGSQQESIFEQINLEWAKGKSFLNIRNVRGATFLSTHMEGLELAGDYPSFIYNDVSQFQMTGLNLLNNKILAANIGLGNGAIIEDGNDGKITLENFSMTWTDPNLVNEAFNLFQRAGYESVKNPTAITGRNWRFVDVQANQPAIGYMSVTDYMPNSMYTNGRFDLINNISQMGDMPKVSQPKLNIVGNFTLYGFMADQAFLLVPTTIGSERTITLSNSFSPAATQGAGYGIPDATHCTVCRGDGTASGFNVVVKDGAGSTIGTISASNTRAKFKRSGGAWVAA